MPTDESAPPSASVDLYWLPLGAGDNTHCVRTNGRIFEWVTARYEHREHLELCHSALEVLTDCRRYVIEMAPVWSFVAPDRGVVGEGPVGLRWLGGSRLFRYEVRCWRDGTIPDLAEAVGGPHRLSEDPALAARVISLAPYFPTATWGRDELGTGDMWNSNSLISWLLARSGHDTDALGPPVHGRAPGWTAGLVLAGREMRHVARPARAAVRHETTTPAGLRGRPGRLALLVFRLPLPLYRAGCGRLMGRTFLVLTHVGRSTGRPHATAAMVLAEDKTAGEVFICSAWGARADWIRNLRAHPALRVQVGRESFVPHHRFLTPAEAFAVGVAFRHLHPWRVRLISRVLGVDLGSEAGIREFVDSRPFVALRPAHSPCRPVRPTRRVEERR